MNKHTLTNGINWIIRIIVAYIFASHGIKALLQNEIMLQYFTFLGFTTSASAILLALVGIVDLIVAGFVLFKPKRIVVIWTIFWPMVVAIMGQVVNPDKLSHFLTHLIEHILPGVILYLVLFTPLVKILIKKLERGKK